MAGQLLRPGLAWTCPVLGNRDLGLVSLTANLKPVISLAFPLKCQSHPNERNGLQEIGTSVIEKGLKDGNEKIRQHAAQRNSSENQCCNFRIFEPLFNDGT